MKHTVESIKFEKKHMLLRVDLKRYRIALEDISERLFNASEIERKAFKVSPSGYGVHWPLLDEDLSIDGLIRASSAMKCPKESA